MDVRVEAQILPPCVEHAHRTAFHPETGVAELPDSLPYRIEQQPIEPGTVKQGKTVQPVWHREHHVVMLYRKGGLHQVIGPECLLRCLALGAMAVPAAVVAYPDLATAITGLLMPAKLRGAANGNGVEHPLLIAVGIALFRKSRSKPGNHIGQLKPVPGHGRRRTTYPRGCAF